jgi:Tfp pilus assembly protein PilN
MNAVNLIPSDYRRRSGSLSASPLTLGVMGGLIVVLAAAVLYVFAVNDVRSRQSELTRVTANAASWKAAANSYTSYVTAAEQRKQQMADVRQLVFGRFPWSLLLGQIGGVMPANAALSNLSATSPSADSSAVSTAPAGTSPSTSSNVSSVQLSGCAASQSAVAATMVALRRVQRVGSVNLASTNNNGPSSGGSSSSSGQSGSGGGCPFPVTFQMSLQLEAGSSGTGASAPAAATTPAATPTASAATSSTGAAQ